MNIDWSEVNRAAYQIELDHGANAFHYAVWLAENAKAESRHEEGEFWAAVAGSLRPRGVSPNCTFSTAALTREA